MANKMWNKTLYSVVFYKSVPFLWNREEDACVLATSFIHTNLSLDPVNILLNLVVEYLNCSPSQVRVGSSLCDLSRSLNKERSNTCWTCFDQRRRWPAWCLGSVGDLRWSRAVVVTSRGGGVGWILAAVEFSDKRV